MTLKDHNGFRKQRPAIIVTPTDEILPNQPLVVMAVTTKFPDPPPSDHVLLPWNPDPRRVGTKLARRSAAVATWLETLYPDEVLDFKGDVPASIMRELQLRLGDQ